MILGYSDVYNYPFTTFSTAFTFQDSLSLKSSNISFNSTCRYSFLSRHSLRQFRNRYCRMILITEMIFCRRSESSISFSFPTFSKSFPTFITTSSSIDLSYCSRRHRQPEAWWRVYRCLRYQENHGGF